MVDEPNFPKQLAAVCQRITPTLQNYFPDSSLRMGGGGVLQARWRHRESTDIDLFSDPNTFHRVVVKNGQQLEQDLFSVDGIDHGRSWIVLTSIYIEIDGVEVSILPVVPLKPLSHRFVVPGTYIETDYTSSILAQKLVFRLGSSFGIELRDLFDLDHAQKHTWADFLSTMELVSTRNANSICAMLSIVDPRILAQSAKPLLGVAHDVDEQELLANMISAIQKAQMELGR